MEGWCAFPLYVAQALNPILIDLEETRVLKASWFGQKWCTFCFNREDCVNEARASWSRGEPGADKWKLVQVTLSSDKVEEFFLFLSDTVHENFVFLEESLILRVLKHAQFDL